MSLDHWEEEEEEGAWVLIIMELEVVEVHPRDLFDLHYVNPWALSLNP
jgi:hypothetical protein